jgi:3-hydroxybutyryl-CoA dehydrogenase
MSVKTIGVVGAGTMGRGIAYAAALGGYWTILEDVSEAMLNEAILWIKTAFDEGIAKGKLHETLRDSALSRISTTSSIQAVSSDTDLIIEAAPEDIQMKLELFAAFDRHANPFTIFASNTTSLSITEMAAVTSRPDRCIGMHFFNPVPKMKLLEIVRALETSKETIAVCSQVGQQMGKEIVVIRESPGFITSRVNAVIGNEAFAMLEAGIASAEDIDKALKLGLNHPMGPFELVDLVGLDVRLKSMDYLHQTLGEKYRPNPLLRQYVKAGRLGRKTGRGVYEYKKDE